MKTYLLAAVVALPAFATVNAQQTVVTTSQPTTSTTTTTDLNAAGTVSSFSPDSSQLVVRTSNGPMTYHYTKKTTFVDADGKVVTYESIHQGDPTTVYYTTVDGQPLVSRVVVNRAPAAVTKTETTETTTTTISKH